VLGPARGRLQRIGVEQRVESASTGRRAVGAEEREDGTRMVVESVGRVTVGRCEDRVPGLGDKS
jgi:hypothetical protein